MHPSVHCSLDSGQSEVLLLYSRTGLSADTKAYRHSGCVRFGEGYLRKEHLWIGKKANQELVDKTVTLELGGGVARGPLLWPTVAEDSFVSRCSHFGLCFLIKMATSCCLWMRQRCHTDTTFV